MFSTKIETPLAHASRILRRHGAVVCVELRPGLELLLPIPDPRLAAPVNLARDVPGADVLNLGLAAIAELRRWTFLGGGPFFPVLALFLGRLRGRLFLHPLRLRLGFGRSLGRFRGRSLLQRRRLVSGLLTLKPHPMSQLGVHIPRPCLGASADPTHHILRRERALFGVTLVTLSLRRFGRRSSQLPRRLRLSAPRPGPLTSRAATRDFAIANLFKLSHGRERRKHAHLERRATASGALGLHSGWALIAAPSGVSSSGVPPSPISRSAIPPACGSLGTSAPTVVTTTAPVGLTRATPSQILGCAIRRLRAVPGFTTLGAAGGSILRFRRGVSRGRDGRTRGSIDIRAGGLFSTPTPFAFGTLSLGAVGTWRTVGGGVLVCFRGPITRDRPRLGWRRRAAGGLRLRPLWTRTAHRRVLAGHRGRGRGRGLLR